MDREKMAPEGVDERCTPLWNITFAEDLPKAKRFGGPDEQPVS
jgi:hypothetical protein